MISIKTVFNLLRSYLPVVALISCSFVAIADDKPAIPSKETLLKQFASMEKLETPLYYENESIRLFGEKNSDLRREKHELLSAVEIFGRNFGAVGSLDVVLVNNQIGRASCRERVLRLG